ncbi:hypothetical protein ACF0H5_023118 [Mactra antiquata]
MQQCQQDDDALDPYMFDELKDAFEFFDVNGDGHICGKELGKVLRALGQNPTEKNIRELLEEADKDGDQVITYDEYIKLLKNKLKDKNVVEIELREAFRVFDKNRDGNLNFQELQRALMCIGEDFLTLEEAQELCKMMDKNGDGKVDVEEFVKYMCRRY